MDDRTTGRGTTIAFYVRSAWFWFSFISASGFLAAMIYLTLSADPGASRALPLLAPFLTFFLFGVLIETPLYLGLLARAFLSKPALRRMTIRAREDLKAMINESIADVSADPLISDLSKCLAEVSVDLLSPYSEAPRLDIKHSSYPGGDSSILAQVNQLHTIRNPRRDAARFDLPFRTTLSAKTACDGKPAFKLLLYRISHNNQSLIEIGEDAVAQTEDPVTGHYVFDAKVPDLSIPRESAVTVVYNSLRVIPFHDIYKYSVQKRPAHDMIITYDYGELSSKHAQVAPNIWLFSRTATIDQLYHSDGKIAWKLAGWLVVGDGFAISW